MRYKVNAKAIWWHTRYMFERHYRNRILTKELRELADAAFDYLSDPSPAAGVLLDVAIMDARKVAVTHGYTPKPKAETTVAANPVGAP